ncbi:MAG: PIN domain-containing protein [Actinomycetota bacterium]|nr:PIN domain-containing protein [Actinomycetota bacterium]
MARVALDADVVIAFLDPSDAQHQRGVEILGARLASGDDVLIAATVYAEVIVRPLQHGTDATVDEFLAAIGAQVVNVDRALARRAAELRARHGALRLPDAVSLATALASDAKLLTLDRALQRIADREPQD